MPRHPASVLKEHSLYASKRKGQNYLTNPAIASAIVNAARVRSEDTVVEIGAGLGALTVPLAQQAGQVIALEIDRGVYQILERMLASYGQARAVLQDALTFTWKDLTRQVKIVANLPYALSSPLLFNMMENIPHWQSATLMLQKDLALRLNARPGARVYSRLSVMVQSLCRIEEHFYVGPDNFFPRPAVDSLVLTLTPLPSPLVPDEEYAWFSQVVRAAFANRRKILLNSLSASLAEDKNRLASLLQENGFDLKCRGETLDIAGLRRLAQALRGLRK
ncbi:MAG: 16S rRNA (adenine(1518)-N(6)/adenine(1519)-N(6))-dimethyltransferase RsmA [Desulfarculales bacterium]|jgi:16S rRNA (adenine1518-N6/adenine1519-N6)-dimethyltransferase|nr:16S rRNA (adenine(1518)-N(6)/adenine(1519)-N(6))-dimethyltransferase RsmA [Desulfarculales bacterium]